MSLRHSAECCIAHRLLARPVREINDVWARTSRRKKNAACVWLRLIMGGLLVPVCITDLTDGLLIP